MRQVIIRDDDTNAFTPPECLEQLYRPFLDRGMPVNLAVIPAVSREAKTPDGKREEFLFRANGIAQKTTPIANNAALVEYLGREPNFRIVQHGCHHDMFEFSIDDEAEISRRIGQGRAHLVDAGFPASKTFVAPHDKFSRAAFRECADHFSVISTGWFELARLPHAWWPYYVVKKLRNSPHWRAGKTLLLSHPGCLLSRFRQRDQIVNQIKAAIESSPLTVLVTHWWEYFPNGKADKDFIAVLHETADYLRSQSEIKVSGFDDLASSQRASQSEDRQQQR